MSEKNKSEDSGRKPTTKKLSKIGSKKTTPQKDVVEQVPKWLKTLLRKYGEPEGRLVGLQLGEDTFFDELGPLPEPDRTSAAEPDSDEPDQLSALLEQMAEDGPPEGDQSATSVEWGAAPVAEEDVPSPIDDLLDTMVAGESDVGQTPDSMPAEAPAEYPDEMFQADDEDATIVLSGEALSAETPAVPEPAAAEVPDWLNEALATDSTGSEIDSAPAVTPAPDQPPVSSGSEGDVPDWLTSIVDDEGSAAGQDTPPEAPVSEGDVPDWLTSGLDDATAVSPPAPAEPAADVPDWLSASATEPAVASSDELPALSEADEIPEIPDWLESVAPEPDVQVDVEQSDTGALAGDQAHDAGGDVPDWLSEMAPTTADAPEPDLMSAEQAVAESALPAGSADLTADEDVELPSWDIPDWIAEASTPEVTAEPSEVQDDEIFDLLASAENAAGLDDRTAEPSPSAEADADDWLAGLEAEATPSEAGPSESEPSAAATEEDWLADVEMPPAAESPGEPPPTAEAEAETEDWLAGLDATQSASESQPPAAGQAVIETEDDETVIIPPPADFSQSSPAEPTSALEDEQTMQELFSLETQEADETDAWPAEEAAAEEELVMPDWLFSSATDQPETEAAATDEAEPIELPGLDEIPATVAQDETGDQATEIETAEGLTDRAEAAASTPEPIAVEEEPETPDWPSDLPGTNAGRAV
jgi:hypothetical protein